MFDNIRYIERFNCCIWADSIDPSWGYEMFWNGHGYLQFGNSYYSMSANHKAF